eukprot:TRINITY_DN3442_c0_g1_i1.p1 TRINITY_DN3442_c0_g1~~TRINITY_DN3442_c0_g1_i1.p1  ORF type:complete len:580 (-),score=122.17 TRINITY_DN3442_c0_g1_i1:312-2051(-)
MACLRSLVFGVAVFALLLLLHLHCGHAHSTQQNPNPKAKDADPDPQVEADDILDLDDDEAEGTSKSTDFAGGGEEDEEFLEEEDFEDANEAAAWAQVDEKDVVNVAGASNFSNFISKNEFALVEFYAPWCGHCQQFAPEYAAAATELKEEIPVAKIDVSEEYDLAQQYNIQGFPTVYLFINGTYTAFNGERTKDGVVSWVKRKLGPSVANLTTTQDAETLLASGSTAVVGLFESPEGPENDILASVSRLEDEVLFYQTNSERVAATLGIDIKAKRPALVLLKKEPEKIAYYDGVFEKEGITQFIKANKLPLVTPFSRDSAHKIFESEIKRHILCFVSVQDYEKIIPTIQEAARSFKGKIIFVHVNVDDEDSGKQVMEYFGLKGEEPKLLAYLASEDSKKFLFEGQISVDNVKTFAEDFLADKLKPFYKSAPIPEKNDGDVKIVVGKNFDEIVLDESKDVLLEIYAPWCGHCQALEPIYNKLGKHLRGVESLVIAKMDGTENDHPRAKSDGYPTILFYPAGSKSFDPITVETERTVKDLYRFLKKNAAIPFTLPKKNTANTAKTSTKEESTVTDGAKDEL